MSHISSTPLVLKIDRKSSSGNTLFKIRQYKQHTKENQKEYKWQEMYSNWYNDKIDILAREL